MASLCSVGPSWTQVLLKASRDMRSIAVCAAFLAGIIAALAQSTELTESTGELSGNSGKTKVSVDYYSATGRPLGSVVTIGGTTYFAAPDGTPLGTSTTMDGHKVYKKY